MYDSMCVYNTRSNTTAVLCLPQLAPCQQIWAKPLIGYDKAKTALSIKSKFLQETLFATVVHKTRSHCLSRLQLHSVYQEATKKQLLREDSGLWGDVQCYQYSEEETRSIHSFSASCTDGCGAAQYTCQ